MGFDVINKRFNHVQVSVQVFYSGKNKKHVHRPYWPFVAKYNHIIHWVYDYSNMKKRMLRDGHNKLVTNAEATL